MAESVNIQVGGNVAGSIVVGDANFVVNSNNGTIVYQQARPQVRLREFAPQAPRPARGFINRTAELAKLSEWISNHEIVLIHAADGIGKSALLRQAANLPAAKQLQNGVVFLENPESQGNTWSADDIIQKLFDALFESEPPIKVDAVSARTYLSNTQPLVLLDEIPLSPGLAHILPDLFPNGSLLLAEDIPLGADYQRMALGPLPRVEAITLLANRAMGELQEDQRPIFDSLCALLKDISLALIITGNIIRETGISPQEALDRLKALSSGVADPLEAVLDRVYRLAFSHLSSDEQKLLSIAAQTPGVSMAPEWLSSALGSNADGALERLKDLGLLYANSPRLRLPSGFRAAARRSSLLDENSVLGKLVDYLLTGAAEGAEFVNNESGNLFGALTWAARTGRPRDVIALARALDARICLQGLWDQWGQILKLTLEAAEQTRDSLTQGWALHQLGTREIGVGTRERAIDYLGHALRVRRSSGDFTGMAYTQHNIDFLLGPPSTPRREEPNPPEPEAKPLPKGTLRPLFMLGALAAGGVILLTLLAGAVALFWRPDATEEPIIPPPVRVTRESAITPEILTFTPTAKLSESTGTPTNTPTPGFTPNASATETPGLTPTPTPFGGSGEIIFQNAGAEFETSFSTTSLYTLELEQFTQKDFNTDFLSSPREPAWAPDGKRLAFTANNDSAFSEIFVTESGGSDWRQITSDFGQEMVGDKSHPSWSPDGKHIVFRYRDPNQRANIFIVDADGSGGNLTNLTENPDGGNFEYPEWSPDGKRIAYQAFVDSNWEIFVMDADGSNQTQLTFGENQEQWSMQPSWSPDGRQLAFASNRSGSWDIYVMDRRGNKVIALTDDSMEDSMPDWSPDGTLIAFTSKRTEFAEIFLMPVSGFDFIQATELQAEAQEVDWRP